MRYILAGVAMVLAFAVSAQPAPAQTMSIAAIVNDDAISMTDVNERMKLIMVSSGLPDNPDIKAKIMPQVVESLIEEQLKMQEAKRNKITIPDEDVANGFKTIAQQNKFEPEQFMMIMEKQGIPKKTLENQIRAQLAWNEVIKKVLRSKVDVSTQDVDTRIERLKSKIGQTEYLVAEIFLPYNDAKRSDEVQGFAKKMAGELQAKKAPFGAIAAQFSKAAGAEKGGSLGWIQTGNLEPALDTVLQKMEEGDISDPINTPAGIYLLNLQKKRTISEDSIPPRDDLTNQIGFERLDRVQQRTLLDLKGSAFIDRRI